MAEVTFRGLDQVVGQLTRLSVQARSRGAAALTGAANRIIDSSLSTYVPRDDNDLADSAVIDPPEHDARGVAVTMAFGRPGTAGHSHALAVHEHISAHSPPSWRIAEASGRGVHFRVGGPKYLEIPYRAEASRLTAAIAAARPFG